jgi:hypothetical protein
VSRRLAGAFVLLVLATASAALAVDVRSWRASIDRGDVVYASAPRSASWTPHAYLDGLAARLLAVDDDVRARRALRLYALASATHQRLDNATQVETVRAEAQDALTAVASGADGPRAAQARTLLGVLTFGTAAAGGEQDQVDSAAADFADAIRADPASAAAKFDLELLLRLSEAHGTRPGAGLGGASGRGGHRGAGGGTPGKGY